MEQKKSDVLQSGHYARLGQMIEDAQVFSGSRALYEKKQELNAVFDAGLVAEWASVKGAPDALLLPLVFGESLAQKAGMPMSHKHYSEHDGDKYGQARRGEIALGLVREGKVVAVMMNKERVMDLINGQGAVLPIAEHG